MDPLPDLGEACSCRLRCTSRKRTILSHPYGLIPDERKSLRLKDREEECLGPSDRGGRGMSQAAPYDVYGELLPVFQTKLAKNT
jgi:hypothetical protein